MNKVILIGNVGKDPEVKYVAENVPVARLSLATTERGYKLPNGTEVPPRTEWHTVILWHGLATLTERYVHKGDKLCIEGKIRSRTYNDKSGALRYAYEIYADNIELLTPRTAQGAPAYPPTQTAQPQPSTMADPLTGAKLPPIGGSDPKTKAPF